jgi:2-polyprenyl-3-methyl-5-hydroxy-6-metoxy-1,4-benzoquinol methylase
MVDQNTQSIIDAVSAYVSSRSPDTPIADLGYGEGWLLERLMREGFVDVTGVGHALGERPGAHTIDGIDLCSKNWSERCGLKRYHVALATEVIEHLTNPFLFLCEVRKLLMPGGEFVLAFPNVHNLRSILGYAPVGRFSGFFGPNFNDGHPLHDQHIFIPNLHLIRYVLKTAGFTVKSEQ